MKYILTLCAGLMAVIGVAACGESHTPSSSKELEQLKMPTHLKADFWELTWEGVDNANGYTVRIFEDEYQTDETEFSLFEYLSPNKRYTLDVKANGDGENYADSEWESVIYQTEKVTENLSVHLISEDDSSPLDGLAGTYEVSIYPNKIPADGRVVLPDYINGRPVTSYNYPRVLNAPLYEYLNLKAIRLPNTLKQVCNGFRNSSVREVHIPNGVEYVGGFVDCKNLTKVYLPDTVTEINNFSGCSALTEIDIPNSVTILGSFKNTGLTKIELPSGLIQIYPNAFLNVRLTEIDLPETLTSIGDNAFQNTDLTELKIPKSVTYVGADILLDTPWYEEQENGFLYVDDVLCGYKGDASSLTSLQKTDFNNNVRLIATSAFSGFSSLQSVVLPDSLQYLGISAFSDCTALSNVSLPNGILSLGHSAFSGCTALEEISLPDSILELGNNVFQNCTKLAHVNIPKKITVIPNQVFWKTAIVSITVPTGIKEIQSSAFASCSNLESVVLPETLEILGTNIFMSCSKLSQINLPDGLTEIQPSMFLRCTSLKEIELPENLVKIGDKAFEKAGLEKIAIPASVKEIGYSAFAGTKLTSVVLPKSLETLDYAAFAECAQLTNIIISSECSGLELVDFYKATALTTFYYTGTQTQWEEKGLPMGNAERLYLDVAMLYYGARSEQSVREELSLWEQNVTIYCYSEVEPIGAGNFWHYDKDGKPVEW